MIQLKPPLKKPPKGFEELLSAYGNPLSYDHPSKYWADHGAFVVVRGTAFTNCLFLQRHSGFWCHKRLKPLFEEVFDDIVEKGLAPYITTFDGCYNHRLIRGGARLSLHAFGAAIDLNAAELPLGSDGRLNEELVNCFTSRGFTYGGDFSGRKDPMHFQYGDY